MTVTANTPFREAGNTDRGSFRSAIARSINGRESPPFHEADAIYDALFAHDLTRLGAAMAWIERRNETDPGGLTYYPRSYHNLWAVKDPRGGPQGWMNFNSYKEAAKHWGSYVLGPTYADLTTIREFINRYAPPFDENDTEFYVRFLVDEINALPLLDEGETPVADPVIYNLTVPAHRERFGLTAAEASRILDNRYVGRPNGRPELIVYHVQDGTTVGSLDWWANGPGVQASSTNMAQQDGSILNIITALDGPWTNGDSKNPSARARRWQQQFGTDLNPVSLTIEAEDRRSGTINAAQKDTILWQVRKWIEAWPHLADPERHLGHFDINSVDKARCGRYRDEIVAALGTTPPPPTDEWDWLPDWLTPEHLKLAFPLADATGAVTKKYVEYANLWDSLPAFSNRKQDGTKSVWLFDGLTILSDGGKVWLPGETT